MNRSPTQPPNTLPSIASRLARALTAWSLALGVAVGMSVWFVVSHEVNELLDDALQASGELMAELTVLLPDSPASAPISGPASATMTLPLPLLERFAWQLLSADGVVVARSTRAPMQPWRRSATPGFAEAQGWRLYGMQVSGGEKFLYVAQTHEERREARADVALSSVLLAFAVGLLGYFGLRAQVRRELQPLDDLSQTLERWDMDDPKGPDAQALGPPQRAELAGVHHALGGVSERLSGRLAQERAFAAHAAHALRTPLGGIDAQLAVVLRDCPSPWRERVQRAREAAARLHGVVAALLGLFRSSERITPVDIDVALLLQRLPAVGVQVDVQPGLRVRGDADLLAAALANLLDNAQRYGARYVKLTACDGPEEVGLQVDDDGPGLSDADRVRLQAVLDGGPEDLQGTAQTSGLGLGLVLADRVARTHGGRLRIDPSPAGFRVVLRWPDLAV